MLSLFAAYSPYNRAAMMTKLLKYQRSGDKNVVNAPGANVVGRVIDLSEK